jgi:hypothetical protein
LQVEQAVDDRVGAQESFRRLDPLLATGSGADRQS